MEEAKSGDDPSRDAPAGQAAKTTLTGANPAGAPLALLLGLLWLRLVLFAAFQTAIGALAATGGAAPWQAGVAWWPVGVVLANLLTIAALVLLLRAEGGSYTALLRIDRRRLAGDMAPLTGLFAAMVVLAVLPNILLAQLIFDRPEAAAESLIHPLPPPLAWALAPVFPVTIALAELPLYFGYIMPRLERRTGASWLAVLLTALFAAAQHVTMPMLPDAAFILWRLLMFLPFTLFLGIVLRLRPRYLPFFAIVHGLLDLSVVAMVLAASGAF